MLEIRGVKGSLEAGADADLVVLSDGSEKGERKLVVEEVWKSGERVFARDVVV
jgi:N-acetylglucosamine-6-phosphate deacetylase